MDASEPSLLPPAAIELVSDAIRTPEWQRDALCKEPEYRGLAWFAQQHEPVDEAKAVCGRCLVQTECLEFALEDQTLDGIWGGTTRSERHKLRTGRPTVV